MRKGTACTILLFMMYNIDRPVRTTLYNRGFEISKAMGAKMMLSCVYTEFASHIAFEHPQKLWCSFALEVSDGLNLLWKINRKNKIFLVPVIKKVNRVIYKYMKILSKTL